MFAKRFFYICAGIFLLALSYHFGAANAAANRDRVVTRELVVTDEAGRQRVTITVDAGGPHLSLSNEAGYPTVLLTGGVHRNKLGKGPYGGFLAFYDAGHTLRAQLGFRVKEGPDRWPAQDEDPGLLLYGKDKTWSALP